MGKNNFNKSYLKDLYESLNVSESAKKRFFEEYLKEDMAQQPQTAEVKKAGIINKFLSFINKRTPTVEQSVQKMMEALTGMEEVINRGSTDDAVKEQHKAILAKYKGQIANATQGLVDANTKYDEAKNRFVQSNPKVAEAEANIEQANAAHEQELDDLDGKIESSKGNLEALNALKADLEQKLQQAQSEDADGGDEYKELIKKVDEYIAAANNPQNPEETVEASEATDETTEKNVESKSDDSGDAPDEVTNDNNATEDVQEETTEAERDSVAEDEPVKK